MAPTKKREISCAKYAINKPRNKKAKTKNDQSKLPPNMAPMKKEKLELETSQLPGQFQQMKVDVKTDIIDVGLSYENACKMLENSIDGVGCGFYTNQNDLVLLLVCGEGRNQIYRPHSIIPSFIDVRDIHFKFTKISIDDAKSSWEMAHFDARCQCIHMRVNGKCSDSGCTIGKISFQKI